MRTYERRLSLAGLIPVLALAACAAPGAAPSAPAPSSDDPAVVHARLFTLDTHIDVEENIATAANDPGGFTTNQADLPKMRAGGLDAGFFILYSAQGPLDAAGYAAARQVVENKYAGIVRMTRAYPDQIALARTAADARAAVAQGKLVAFLGMENAYPLGEGVEDVSMWAARGVTYMGIAHFGHNQFGDSANGPGGTPAPPPVHDGLSPLGVELVHAMNRAGIMVDVSHSAKSTMMDAVSVSDAPIIASHSAVSGVYDNPRSLDDEQLRAIAATGGVAQIVAYASYLAPETPERAAAVAALREEVHLPAGASPATLYPESAALYAARMADIDRRLPRASVSDFVDHIDHAVAVAGIDHVGIASDFDGGGGIDGWRDASETEAVTAELLRRGYTEEQLDKIWNGNLLRVLEEVQAEGRELRGE
jgi:membrane dipeptidase